MLAADAALHTVLNVAAGAAYRARYRLMVELFRNQAPAAIFSGALLAACEELLFRGVLWIGLDRLLGGSVPPTLLLTSFAFGLAHRRSGLGGNLFALWAMWEGVILGALLLASGSLTAVALAHAVHDGVGFAVFAWERRLRGR
jgi:membrane protease YdiL (CAAX protease family)